MKSFVKKNSYKILNQYVDKKEFNDSCKKSIFKNIRLIAGSEIEKKVREEGLEKIHKYFPVEYVPFLQFAIGQDLEKFYIFKCIMSEYKIASSIKVFFLIKLLILEFIIPSKMRKDQN